jgi:hypothetical protein
VEDLLMAKALFGHVGNVDYQLLAEVRRLRCRVAELEAELAVARAHSDVLDAAVVVVDRADAAAREPALT